MAKTSPGSPDGVLQAVVETYRGLSEFPLLDVGREGYGAEFRNVFIDENLKPSARKGLQAMKPFGGVSIAPTDGAYGGIYTGFYENQTPWAWVLRRSAGGVYSGNLANQAFFDLFPGVAVGSRLGIGSPQRFGSALFNIGRASGGGGPIVWKYSKADGTEGLLAAVVAQFNATGQLRISFSAPADWGTFTYDNRFGYWIWAEVTAAPLVAIPTQTTEKVGADWKGNRELYYTMSAEALGSGNGKLLQQGEDYSVGPYENRYRAVSTTLFSAGNPRSRLASMQGILYLVNGVDQKRWDGLTLADVGFPKSTVAPSAAINGTGLTGIFQWYVTLGYGPKGEWGESEPILVTTGGANNTLTLTNQGARLTLTAGFVAALPATVDRLYVYRSIDLSTVEQASTFGNFPAYLSLTKDKDTVTGAFNGAGFTVDDNSQELPKPLRPLKRRANLPPSRCRFVGVNRGSLFLGGSDLFPGRVWWARATNREAFDVENIYFDPPGGRSGILTGLIDFADQMVLFYESDMYGITDTDQDQASIYSIISGVGCIAPESICVSNGFLMWLSRHGIYRWDGVNPPERVSKHIKRLTKLSYERYGGTRALFHDFRYELQLMNPSNQVLALPRYVYHLISGGITDYEYATTDPTVGPLGVATLPLSHEDFGNRHPLYGRVQTGGTDYNLYVGDWTALDGGNAYSCAVTMLMDLGIPMLVKPHRLFANYINLTNAVFSFSTSAYLQSTPVLAAAVTADTADDVTVGRARVHRRVIKTGNLRFRAQFTPTAALTAQLLKQILEYEPEEFLS